jgi:hypothetical protein
VPLSGVFRFFPRDFPRGAARLRKWRQQSAFSRRIGARVIGLQRSPFSWRISGKPDIREGSGAPENGGACEAPWAAGEAARACPAARGTPCDRECAPSGALLAASFRSRATLSGAFARRSASSWQEVRSDLRVEPRVARVRNAFRARVPRLAPLNQDASGRRPSMSKVVGGKADRMILVKEYLQSRP